MKTILVDFDDNYKPVRAIVDDEDYEWLNSYTWHCRKSKNRDLFYPKRTITKAEYGDDYIRHHRLGVYMHHIIVGYPLHGLVVDHINQNPLDNRRSNLRIVSTRQNANNTSRSRGNICRNNNGYSFSIYVKDKALADKIREYALKLIEDNENN